MYLPFLGLAGSGQWGRRHDIRGCHRARVGDVPTLTQLGRGAGCPDLYAAGVIIVIQRTHSGAKIYKCVFDIWDIKTEYWATYSGISREELTLWQVYLRAQFLCPLYSTLTQPLLWVHSLTRAQQWSQTLLNLSEIIEKHEFKQNVFISKQENLHCMCLTSICK